MPFLPARPPPVVRRRASLGSALAEPRKQNGGSGFYFMEAGLAPLGGSQAGLGRYNSPPDREEAMESRVIKGLAGMCPIRVARGLSTS